MPRVAITVPGKKSQPYRFQLDHEKVKIGRSKDSDIVIDCPSVSGLHCTMERVPGGYILRDQNSTNGLKLKDEEMAVIDLRNDIDVFVGDAEFEYSLSDEELDELDDEDFTPHAKKASEMDSPKDRDDDEDDSDDEDAPKKKKRPKVVPAPARRATPPATPVPVVTSSSGSFLGIATFICGFLAFCAGLDHSYRGDQKDLGREGEITLLGDIKNGQPAPPEKDPKD